MMLCLLCCVIICIISNYQFKLSLHIPCFAFGNSHIICGTIFFYIRAVHCDIIKVFC